AFLFVPYSKPVYYQGISCTERNYLSPHHLPVQFHKFVNLKSYKPLTIILPVKYCRNFSVSAVSLSLIHSVMDIQILHSLAFNMYARKSNDISISVCSAVLLPSPAIISILP